MSGENPRWTRCREAIGREPKVFEFTTWNDRCWREFAALHGCRDSTSARLKLGFYETDTLFDAFQAAGVTAGKWRDVPGETPPA